MSLVYKVDELFRGELKHHSWKEIELNLVCYIQNGFAFKSTYFNSSSKGIPLIRIRDILQGKTENYYLGDYSNEFIVKFGDLLVGMDGDFNHSLWSGENGLLNQRVCRIIANEKFIVKKFIYYGLGKYLTHINNYTSSTTVKHLSSNTIGEIPFPLPPLPEQHRIVSKLDALFAHTDNLKAKLNRIPELLKNFRQQVLTQAVTGKFFGNKRYDFVNLSDFEISIQTGPFGSTLHKEDYINNGIPIINPSHIFDGKIIADCDVSISEVKFKELKVWMLSDGDIVLGRRGEMGRAAKYVESQGTMVCGTGSLIIRKSNKIDSDFLSLYLRSPFAISFLEKNSVGSTMTNLNQSIIKALPFPNVPLEEQQEIVRRVEALFALADKIEARYNTLKEKIDTLPQAILNKAFKGELVPQNPKDEPASVLLERIKAEKEKTGNLKTKKEKQKKYKIGDRVGMVAEP